MVRFRFLLTPIFKLTVSTGPMPPHMSLESVVQFTCAMRPGLPPRTPTPLHILEASSLISNFVVVDAWTLGAR
jgi:hypothetical protein